jgi:hypothetical protein
MRVSDGYGDDWWAKRFSEHQATSENTVFVRTEALRQSPQSDPNIHAYYVLYLGLSIASGCIFILILDLNLSIDTIR